MEICKLDLRDFLLPQEKVGGKAEEGPGLDSHHLNLNMPLQNPLHLLVSCLKCCLTDDFVANSAPYSFKDPTGLLIALAS